MLDFGEDEEEEEEEKKETATEKPKEAEQLPATEAPIIVEPVVSEDDEPVPTEAAVLKIVKATPPPPVKKIVKVNMPPLKNLQAASGEGNKEAAGLVCVVFETPALFPTNKTAQKEAEIATGVVVQEKVCK